MTTIIYNTVEMRDCEILSFDQDVQYDESDTDVMFSRFKIRVASTLVAVRDESGSDGLNQHIRKFHSGIDTKNGTTAAQRLHDIQAKLSEPRKDFWMLIDSCVQDERQTQGNALPILDQPLLLATGEAWTEAIVTTTVNGQAVDTVTRTPLMMKLHPYSEVSVAETNEYSSGDASASDLEIDKKNVLDCDNGPKPKKVSIKKIIGGRSFSVEFEIEICRSYCSKQFVDSEPIVYGGSLVPSGEKVLSNRWSITESKDDNWVTTRSMQGTLRVAHSSYWPHAMRLLCIPALLNGYRRASQSFVSDPTDTILKWRVDDVQAHAAPPYPAIKWSGHHAESASGPNGMTKGGEFRIRLQGPPGVDKQQLIGAAGKVAVNRIRGLNPKPDANGNRTYDLTLVNASVVDVLDQPVIEMRVQVTYHDASFKSLALRVKNMGSSLDTLDGHGYGYDPELDPYLIAGYNPRVWPVPLAYDSDTPAGVFNCYLQHPCSVWHSVPNGLSPEEEAELARTVPVGDLPSAIESGRADGSENSQLQMQLYPEDQNLPEDDAQTSNDSDLYDFPYSFVELQNRYRVDNGYVQIPLSTNDPDAQKTSSIVQFHGRIAKRVLTMTAVRDGKPPTLPSLVESQVDPNGIREVLSEYNIIAKAPQLMADGTGRRFEVFAEYVYMMERAPKINELLRGASTPMDLFSPDANELDLAQIVDASGQLQWETDITVRYPPPPTV